RGAAAYEPVFHDARRAGAWLPRTIYLTRYADPSTQRIADFEEDVDVTTGSIPGVALEAHRLAAWRELGLSMRARGAQPYENHAVRVGWTAPTGTTAAASYDVRFGDSTAAALGIGGQSMLVFEAEGESAKPRALAPSDTAPGVGPMPRPPRFAWLPGWLRGQAPHDSTARPDRAKARDKATADSARTARKAGADSVKPIDFHVEVETSDGIRASMALIDLAPLPPPLTIRLYKWARQEAAWGGGSRDYDQVLTKYTLPLAQLARTTPGFDPARVRVIRFVFDRTKAGSVLLDNIGFERAPAP
ncbi:MAG: hypothetical protein ACYC3L_14720, partial [Gemmatimonadaceae bacterium]